MKRLTCNNVFTNTRASQNKYMYQKTHADVSEHIYIYIYVDRIRIQERLIRLIRIKRHADVSEDIYVYIERECKHMSVSKDLYVSKDMLMYQKTYMYI